MTTVDLRLHLDSNGRGIHASLADAFSGAVLGTSEPVHIDLSELSSCVEKLHRQSRSSDEWVGLGQRLAAVALPPPIARPLKANLTRGRLRIWLGAGTPEVLSLPWEYLGWDESGDILHLVCHPLVSFLRGDPSLSPLRFRRSEELRILLACADPASQQYGSLVSADKELRGIRNALKSHECDSYEVRELRRATPAHLLEDLEQFRPHILHFIGHGTVAPSGGALVLESGKRNEHEMLYADDLASHVQRAGTKLVVLSGCLTAGCAASVGEVLASRAGTCVVGMQLAIRDSTASLFARALFAALAAGEPIDEAVQQGRAAIIGCDHEWGIPILIVGGKGQPAEAEETVPARTNFVQDARPFIGRRKQQERLWSLFRDPDVRMVTLFGMGGMGKTRLAKRVGEDLSSNFRDGVRLVECDVLQGLDELIGALANAVGADPSGGLDGLAAHLKDKKLLLIIDCFEKHIDHSGILDILLRRASGLKLLVTSRIILNLEWEHTYELEELAKKKSKSASSSERMDLFIDAAKYADPHFEAKKHWKTIEALVDLLQGVPLALVLAAGRLRHLSIEELYERLQKKLLDTLQRAGGPRDRHASLRIVVQDSFDLLAEAERNLAMSLSVFVGGFTLEDVRAVVPEETGIELHLDRLCDQSFLISRDRRYQALDTVREYLSQVAEVLDLSAIHCRHAAHYASRARVVRQLFDRGEMASAGDRLWRDIGNFRSAVRYAVQLEDGNLVSDLAKSLGRVFLEVGIRSDFALIADQGERFAMAQNDNKLLAELRGLQGTQKRRDGDYAAAETLWRERAKLCHDMGDRLGEADTYLDIGDLSLKLRKFGKVREMLDRFQGIEPPIDDTSLEASALLLEAKLAIAQEDLPRALELAKKAEAVELSDSVSTAQFLYVWLSLAQIYFAGDAPETAIRYCVKILVDACQGGFAHNACVTLLELSTVLEKCERHTDALESILLAAAIAKRLTQSHRKRVNGRLKSFRGRHLQFEPTSSVRSPKSQPWQQSLSLWIRRLKAD